MLGTSGVESGKAAPLVGGPPGVELHTIVVGVPSGDTGDIVPVVLPTIGVGIVPIGAAAPITGIVMVGDATLPMLPDETAETVLGRVDDVGTAGAVIDGGGRAGIAGGGGAGTVVPGKSEMNDVAGTWENVSCELVTVDVEALATADVVGDAGVDGIGPVTPPMADIGATGTAGVPGAICPVGVEQVTTVPGVVGSEASGTGASVVSGVPGWVVAENGLGP
jgi:hypothetical protein